MKQKQNAPKVGALLIALILIVVATLLLVLVPGSANLTVAYVFCLIGIVLMEGGFLLATTKNVPASYTLIGQTGRFLPWSLAVSVMVLVLERIGLFTLPPVWHAALQVILLAITSIKLVQVFSGAAYIEQVEAQVAQKRNAWVELTNCANMLAAREENAEAKAALKKVAEVLRYADPMSVAATEEIESRIEALLKQAQGDECKGKCEEVLLLIQERNMIVKANK